MVVSLELPSGCKLEVSGSMSRLNRLFHRAASHACLPNPFRKGKPSLLLLTKVIQIIPNLIKQGYQWLWAGCLLSCMLYGALLVNSAQIDALP